MTRYKTKTGRTLTDADIDVIADELELADYDIDTLKTRRRGHSAMGSGPADIVSLRIDPKLKAEIEACAEANHTTAGEIIRETIRRFLTHPVEDQSA